MFKKLKQVVTVGDRVTHQVHPGVLNTLNYYTVDPPIPPLPGLAKKRQYWKTAVKVVILYINRKKNIRDLKISGGIGGEGGSQ